MARKMSRKQKALLRRDLKAKPRLGVSADQMALRTLDAIEEAARPPSPPPMYNFIQMTERAALERTKALVQSANSILGALVQGIPKGDRGMVQLGISEQQARAVHEVLTNAGY